MQFPENAIGKRLGSPVKPVAIAEQISAPCAAMPRKLKTARAPAEPPQGYAVLSHDDLQSAFACDDFEMIVRYYKQNPAPDRVSTAMLVEWLQARRRGRGRPPADDVRRDAENAVIELAVAGNPKGRKDGRFRAATSLRCSESKITHALSRTRGK